MLRYLDSDSTLDCRGMFRDSGLGCGLAFCMHKIEIQTFYSFRNCSRSFCFTIHFLLCHVMVEQFVWEGAFKHSPVQSPYNEHLQLGQVA